MFKCRKLYQCNATTTLQCYRNVMVVNFKYLRTDLKRKEKRIVKVTNRHRDKCNWTWGIDGKHSIKEPLYNSQLMYVIKYLDISKGNGICISCANVLGNVTNYLPWGPTLCLVRYKSGINGMDPKYKDVALAG